MKNLIIGAGGLAREILSWIGNSDKYENLIIDGFLDDNLQALKAYDLNLSLLGPISSCSNFSSTHHFLMGVMDCSFKESFFLKHKGVNLKFSSFFHQSCLVGDRSVFGEGTIVTPNATISCDVTIGNLVFINNGSQIGHDVKIGDYCSIMANVDLGGGVELGNNVFIGSGSTILPGVKIAPNTRIGAGAVVLKSIKTPGTYFGNPAKKVF